MQLPVDPLPTQAQIQFDPVCDGPEASVAGAAQSRLLSGGLVKSCPFAGPQDPDAGTDAEQLVLPEVPPWQVHCQLMPERVGAVADEKPGAQSAAPLGAVAKVPPSADPHPPAAAVSMAEQLSLAPVAVL